MSEQEKEKSGASEEDELAIRLGLCYEGPCSNKGNTLPIGMQTKSKCKQAGGKSWVYSGECYNLDD